MLIKSRTEVQNIMNDLMSGANTKDKWLEGTENLDFALFGIDNRICPDPANPTGPAIDCRNAKTPRERTCHASASSG